MQSYLRKYGSYAERVVVYVYAKLQANLVRGYQSKIGIIQQRLICLFKNVMKNILHVEHMIKLLEMIKPKVLPKKPTMQ